MRREQRLGRRALIPAALAAVLCFAAFPAAQERITKDNWGRVTSPVYGTGSDERSGAERFAGPAQFDDEYYHGVLPNGRIVKPAGRSVQIGMMPLGARLTPDGRFLVTSNNDDVSGTMSIRGPNVAAGYSLSVIDTKTFTVVSQVNAVGRFFVGLRITGTGPYTVWASGGGDDNLKRFTLSASGTLTADGTLTIAPVRSAQAGFMSNYKPAKELNAADADGNKPPVPTGFNRTAGQAATAPAGSALSPDGRYLYVACNGDNSLAIIDTTTFKVVKQVPVGYFPYDVVVSDDGRTVFVSNWGVTEYKFANPTYGPDGTLTAIAPAGKNEPAGFFVPKTDTRGETPQTSSVAVVSVPDGDPAKATLVKSVYLGEELDELEQVGDTHPSATALVRSGTRTYLYVTKANVDAIGIIALERRGSGGNSRLVANVRKDFELTPVRVPRLEPEVRGAYPNAIVVSPDQTKAYVAEAGLNSVAVLDIRAPEKPVLVGRIPTGWYPTALEISSDAKTLYVINAKGIGQDLRPRGGRAPASRVPAVTGAMMNIDSNYIYGSAQQIDLTALRLDNTTVLGQNFALAPSVDTRVVPEGGSKPSKKIKHVFFILHENKTFDSMLGNLTALGPFASMSFQDSTGAEYPSAQHTAVAKNLQALASRFSVGVNYYSDSEESNGGHQFAASGTISDFAEKTLEVKSSRGLLTNKDMEAEDYPSSGYIFNNAARHGVSFKDYGDLIRILGTDTGTSTPTVLNDPTSGKAGLPTLPLTSPITNQGDVDSPTQGLGQSYFSTTPILAVLGGKNRNGEPRLDHNYPGYNFNISDQRRAQEFCRDFDRMLKQGTLPQLLWIYLPNDHMGNITAKNLTDRSPAMQVADGDVALGMVVDHIMRSPVYYNAATGDGSAIFITFDDAQSTMDHIHPHRTPLVMVSPYAKPGPALRHYSTASIVKTEELLLGLPPNNLGDLFATDLREMFQPEYNGITADAFAFARTYAHKSSAEGERIWSLVERLDLSEPDQDSRRLGALARLSELADEWHAEAATRGALDDPDYRRRQAELYEFADLITK